MIEYKGSNNISISGSNLKIIAMIIMIIDHIGLALWWRLPDMGYLVPDIMTEQVWYDVYRCMRNIGRTAFPIFCFLLVEGFFHTSSKLKYAVRLLLFSFFSQLPFHYAFLNLVPGLNVFFTLLIGLITIWGMDVAEHRLSKWYIVWAGKLFLLVVGGYVAALLETDYGWKGVLLIGIFYLLRERRLISLIVGYLSFIWEPFCLPAFFLIWFYNGERGIGLKYLFYMIYPLHLFVLYVIWRYLL